MSHVLRDSTYMCFVDLDTYGACFSIIKLRWGDVPLVMGTNRAHHYSIHVIRAHSKYFEGAGDLNF